MARGRAPLLVLLGTLLLQAAWIVAVPPYRGSDEFDHVYRAASVAHGYWRPDSQPAPDGRGGLIPVPRQIVTDGTEVCSSYSYTKPDNCHPVEDLDDGLVTVASAAQQYFPPYYAAVGWPSLFLEGAPAVYAMRIVSALMCALVISLAAWSVAGWSRSPWPMVGMVVALTPVTIYSSIVVAPNALEIVAGLCVWSALTGLSRRGTRNVGLQVTALAIGGCLLAGVRPLGPLWLALILGTAGLAFGIAQGLTTLRSRPWTTLAGFASVTAVLGVAVWWTLASRQLTNVETVGAQVADATFNPWGRALQEVPLWVFQSLAASPLRNNPAPMIVYACGLVTFGVFLTMGLRYGDARHRRSMAVCALVSLALPYAVTVATLATAGTFWQGRYTLPYAVGICFLVGSALDRRAPGLRSVRPLVWCGAACLLVVHVVSIVGVLTRELLASPLSGDPRWFVLPTWLVASIAVAGTGLLTLACRPTSSTPASSTRGTAPRQTPEADVASSLPGR